VWVAFEDQAIVDAVRGEDRGHILARVYWNWPDAELIVVLAEARIDRR
jgi:hypothetical protein